MSSLTRAAGFILFAALASAQREQPSIYSIPPPDAPELAPRGAYPVGVRTLSITHRGQIDILHADKATGAAPLYDRPLTVEIWYPALIPPGEREETTYLMPLPVEKGAPPEVVRIPDKALRDAPPLPGKQFPLVILSHGYPGSRYFLSYLTSNLASKGYVVAAIDHTDSVFGNVQAFESTLLNRSSDQLFVIDEITRLSHTPEHFLNGLLHPEQAAIVGYSMGGYGALVSAGAGLNPQSMANHLVPHGYLSGSLAGNANFLARDRSRVKAIVAIAPWGEQPPFNCWTKEGLAGVRVPALFIAGDHDDIASFTNGIEPAFRNAVNSERYLLVYEGARHNTGGNPAPSDLPLSYPLLQAFDEPVWRKNRITAINQHFVTAFLDLYLKGDESKRSYLNVQPAHSSDGVWPAKIGAADTGTFSKGQDAAGNPFWKGFPRRSALGLEMYRESPGEKTTANTSRR